MKTIFISLLITMFFSINASAQCKGCVQTVNVQHLNYSTGTQGCVSVALIVSYTLNGSSYSVMGNAVVVNPSTTTSLGIAIPQGATVINKVVRFITSGGDYFNHTAGSYNQTFCNGTSTQLCDPSSGGTKQLFIESTTATLVTFHVNQIGTGGC
ncbi:MAG: hypothetical protein ACI976_000662 [Aureispira sp.]|jgi:hypothetical protein